MIDDYIDLAENLALWLRMRGHAVRTAYDGFSGLATAQEFHPDVVITDVNLPDTHGTAIAEQLRRLLETAHALLIAMTGLDDEGVRQQLRTAGVQVCLLKPVDPQHVLTIIENSLRTK